MDIVHRIERAVVADLTQEGSGLVADLPAKLLVFFDTMHHTERHKGRRTGMGLRRKAQLGDIRVFAAQRRFDPYEILGAPVVQFGH